MIPHLALGVRLPFAGLMLLATALLAFPFFSALSVSKGKPRVLVIAIRLLLWGFTLIFFLRVALVFTNKEALRKPLAVVVDRSKSISLPADKNLSRWDQFKGLLESK